MLEAGRRILLCNWVETPCPSKTKFSWDQEGPSSSTGREEPRQLGCLSSPHYRVVRQLAPLMPWCSGAPLSLQERLSLQPSSTRKWRYSTR